MSKDYVTKKCIGLFAALILFISAACFTAYAYEIKKEVRVGINFGSTALTDVSVISSEESINIAIEGFSEPLNIMTNMLSLSVENGFLYVRTVFGGDVVYADKNVKISLYPSDSTSGLTVNGVHYYGGFELYADDSGRIVAINVLDIDEYIKGVLPSEIYPSWNMEALKAAAVVSRTYALRNVASSSHASSGFDVCNNTHCQMYEGTKKENENTNRAIEETAGIVVMYNGALAMTPYHSSTGGFTASAAEVWGGKPESYPYLTNIFNPYEQYYTVPNGKWESVVPTTDIMSFIPSAYTEKLPGGNLTFNCERTSSGYISKMTVTDSLGNSITLNTADRVRNFFGKLVKSANFGIAHTYIPSNSYSYGVQILSADGLHDFTGIGGYEYITADGTMTATGFSPVTVFDGSGYGHGVGMSQFGSRDMANSGFTYEQILASYFPGTELVSINEETGNEDVYAYPFN